jgi:hypothetical protein
LGSASFYQYGDPATPRIQDQDANFDNFDPVSTLNNLKTKNNLAQTSGTNTDCNYKKSIQTMVLEMGGEARVFDIDNYAVTIPLWFQSVIRYYELQNCKPDVCYNYQCHDATGCSKSLLCGPGCNQCMIGATCYEEGTMNPGGGCEACQPTQSNTSWTPCNDQDACTVNKCTGGKCDFSEPVCPSLPCGKCKIGGTCYVAGAPNPSNVRERCDPASSLTAWTPFNISTCVTLQTCNTPTPKVRVPFFSTFFKSIRATCACLLTSLLFVPLTPKKTNKQDCGQIPDGCGNVLNCGSCNGLPGLQCNSAFQCECVPTT